MQVTNFSQFVRGYPIGVPFIRDFGAKEYECIRLDHKSMVRRTLGEDSYKQIALVFLPSSPTEVIELDSGYLFDAMQAMRVFNTNPHYATITEPAVLRCAPIHIDLAKVTAHACNCELVALMQAGCKCGGL